MAYPTLVKMGSSRSICLAEITKGYLPAFDSEQLVRRAKMPEIEGCALLPLTSSHSLVI